MNTPFAQLSLNERLAAFAESDRQIAEIRKENAVYQPQSAGFVQIIGDEMPHTQHPADGQMYSSKSKFRAETRAHECTEVGSERLSQRKREAAEIENPREMISHVYDVLRNGGKIESDGSLKGF